MTGSNISKIISNYHTGGSSRVSSDSSKKTESTDAFFASMIGQMNSGANLQMDIPLQKDTSPETAPCVEPAETATNEERMKDYISAKTQDKIRRAQDPASAAKETAKELTEETEAAVGDLIEEKLGVTEEELHAALDALGMNMLDLLNPSNLVQLVSKLTGAGETSNLLMSEEFVDIMQAMSDLTENLATELSITPQELLSMIAEPAEENMQPEMNGQTDEPVVVAKPEVLPDQQAQPAEYPEEPAKDGLEGIPLYKEETPAKDDANLQTADASEGSKAFEALAQKNPNAEENLAQSEDGSHPNTGKELAAEDDGTKHTQTTLFESGFVQPMAQAATAEAVSAPAAQVYTANVDVEEILSQIAEFVKISVAQDVSSIEMQLNPESLGKLYLQLTSTREGAVTAQFAAQNEAVKEALEAQIIELRQTLNQQGVKVDAIEVTVATHEFERNLEQNAKGGQQRDEQNTRRRGRRSLNLNQLDELSGLMSEEEMLAVRIMRENGNRMDVQA